MNKKIIAIALMLVMMATAFVGCQKYKTIELYGKEYVPYTDEDGNTVLNEDNNLVVVVTDENGEVITFENGEEQTYFVEIHGNTLDDGKTHNDVGSFTVIDGWEGTNNGELRRNGTDGACSIKAVYVGKTTEENTYDIYLEKFEKQSNAIIAELEKQGYKAEMLKSTTSITKEGIDSQKYVFKIIDKDGKLIHYAENFYFTNEDAIYSIDYVCRDGIGYDESFDFNAYLNSNFVFTK